ncbi:hypothetical protein ONS96_011860 [Cadophora gregata f. sp. sojae]|nr:hypothetical protein ONS96_011860 [Cadophora gregata f. sp. sojae]
MTRKLKTTTYLRMRVFSKTLKRDQCIKVYNRKYRNTSAYLLPPDEGFDFVMHSRVNILIEAADNGTSSEHPKQRTCSKRCAFSYYPNCLLRAGQQMTGSWLWVSLANNQTVLCDNEAVKYPKGCLLACWLIRFATARLSVVPAYSHVGGFLRLERESYSVTCQQLVGVLAHLQTSVPPSTT